MKTEGYRHTSGFLWTALIILIGGCIVRYVLLLDRINTQAAYQASLTLLISIIAAGICLICAMASWWVKR